MALKDIETIIIVMMENRSFDHGLGYLSVASKRATPVDGVRHDARWLARHANLYHGQSYQSHAISVEAIPDPPHEHVTIAQQIDTPPASGSPDQMGGFVASYMSADVKPSDPSLVMGYYTAASVPTFEFFASNYAVCDHWFASLPTGTQANRLMAMRGETTLIDNAPLFLPDQPLVYDWLTSRKVPWCVYQSGNFLPFFSLMPKWLPEMATGLTASYAGLPSRFRRYSRFSREWRDNARPMPNVIFIEPEYTDGPHSAPNDDHPPTGISPGQAFLADVHNVVKSNPARWAKSLMVVTYDEHGGFYDHVPPLPVATEVSGYRFKTTGVRVPAFVISPSVKRASVISGNLDHTSILQLLADRYTSDQVYSAAVTARQGAKDASGRPVFARLAAVLEGRLRQRRTARAPGLAVRRLAASRRAPTPSGDSASATANARAMWAAANKLLKDHPELAGHPAWRELQRQFEVKD